MIIEIRRCDKCGAEDDRKARGWFYSAGRDVCPSCAEQCATFMEELDSRRIEEIAKFFGEVK